MANEKETKEQDLRKKYRDHLSSKKKNFEKVLVKVDDFEYEVRQPTVKKRGQILKKSEAVTEKTKERDIALISVWSVIDLTYIAGTDILVFDKADFKWLMELPTGGWFDELTTAAQKMMAVAKEKAKNLKGTETDNSSSE